MDDDERALAGDEVEAPGDAAAFAPVGTMERVLRYRLGELSSTKESDAFTPCTPWVSGMVLVVADADVEADVEEEDVGADSERVDGDGTKYGIRRKRRSSLIADSLELDAHHEEKLAVMYAGSVELAVIIKISRGQLTSERGRDLLRWLQKRYIAQFSSSRDVLCRRELALGRKARR